MCPAVLDRQAQQQRETEIIEATLALLEEIDLALLTMDKVVERINYSKGTIYNHFCSKEDLIVAIGNYALSQMIKHFKRLLETAAGSREQFIKLALGYLVQALYKPSLFRTSLCSKSPAVLGKASSARRTKQQVLEAKLMRQISQVIDQGVDEGNLVQPEQMSREQLCFACWSGAFGVLMMLNADFDRCLGRSGLILEQQYLGAAHIFLDGLNWQPLCGEQDNRKIARLILEQHFCSEIDALAARGRPILI